MIVINRLTLQIEGGGGGILDSSKSREICIGMKTSL
jgi:hypothetical protein